MFELDYFCILYFKKTFDKIWVMYATTTFFARILAKATTDNTRLQFHHHITEKCYSASRELSASDRSRDSLC